MRKRGKVTFPLAAVACLSLATGALAANNGEPASPLAAPVGPTPTGYSLIYDNFIGACSANSFSTTADAHVILATDAQVDGRTTLDGSPYDTFTFALPAGVYDFATGFSRTFTPALADATYTFVFYSRLLAAGDQGTTVTTITCENGTFSATSVFQRTSIQAIPTLGQLGLSALALLLGGGAVFALRRRS